MCFTLVKAPICWESALRYTVAFSIREAEYLAITKVVNKAIWFQGLLKGLEVMQKHITVYYDSQSVLLLFINLGRGVYVLLFIGPIPKFVLSNLF